MTDPNTTFERVTEYGVSCYLVEHHRERLSQILMEPIKSKCYALEISFIDLPGMLGSCILSDPDNTFPLCNMAIQRAQATLHDMQTDKTGSSVKPNVHLRIHTLIDLPKIFRETFPVDVADCGKFFALTGTVVRSSKPKLLQTIREMQCSKCKSVSEVKSIRNRYHSFPSDSVCSHCGNSALKQIDDYETRHTRVNDYQEIRIQQLDSVACFSSSMTVVLENDIVDACKPGDIVVITGTLFTRWKPFRVDAVVKAELAFRGNHVTIANDSRASECLTHDDIRTFEEFWAQYKDNPFKGRSIILRSFAPNIFGLYTVKTALSLVILGGVAQESAGHRTRGQPHILLAGSPGIGKSQLLKYITKITPRSIFTTGAGVSNAGLTGAAMMHNNEWHIDAGALVLASGGYCVIDEISCMSSNDQVSIHESMEQQTVSIAKAGMMVTLNSRCSVLASTNPKLLAYDQSKSLEENIGLSNTLLSRFDLMYILTDSPNAVYDEYLSNFILETGNQDQTTSAELLWTPEKLMKYFIWAKAKEPQISPEAFKILSSYYALQRQNEHRTTSRTTVRLLDSLTRLGQAHAKLCCHSAVTVMDAVYVVRLMDVSMHKSALWDFPELLHVQAPSDPIQEYYADAELILNALGLDDVWQREKFFLDRLITDSGSSSG